MNKEKMVGEKPISEMTYKEVWGILLKRAMALPSKLIGFKPFCLYLATYLLFKEKLDSWVWLVVLVMVIFGREGLKLIAGLKR